MAMTHRPFRDSMQFLGTFARNPTTVGAVLPSSRFLARALAEGLQLQRGDVVVEYGPGTGPVTAVLEPQLGEGVSYLALERDAGFVARLRARFPALHIHHGSVEQVERVLATAGLGKARYVISGLPFASLPDSVQKRVVVATRRILCQDGEFRTFQYVHAYHLPAAVSFRRAMRKRFGSFERSRPIMRNVPPAYVLTYRP